MTAVGGVSLWLPLHLPLHYPKVDHVLGGEFGALGGTGGDGGLEIAVADAGGGVAGLGLAGCFSCH